MEDRLFRHLLTNEPRATQLTKQQYDAIQEARSDSGGAEQQRPGPGDKEDVDGVLQQAPNEKDGAPVPTEGTTNAKIRTYLIEERGFTDEKLLKRKNKQQLLDLL